VHDENQVLLTFFPCCFFTTTF